MSAGSGSLPRYIGQRLLLIIPMIWVLLTMVFVLLRVAPGDPVSAAVGGKLNEAALDERRAALGLDRPLFVQYLDYMGDVARLNFGQTISDNRPIVDIIRDNGGATLSLTLGAFLFALLIGIPLGLLAGRHRDSAGDELRNQQADDRDHREQRAAQGVADQHDPAPQALGPGGRHVLAVEHLEHARPRVAHQRRRVRETEDQHRHHQVRDEVAEGEGLSGGEHLAGG